MEARTKGIAPLDWEAPFGQIGFERRLKEARKAFGHGGVFPWTEKGKELESDRAAYLEGS